MDAQQPWKKKGGTASWMAAAGALESGDSEPRLQLLRGHAYQLLARHLKRERSHTLHCTSTVANENALTRRSHDADARC